MKKIVIMGDSIAAGFFEGQVTDLLNEYVTDTLTGMGFPDYTVVNLGERGASSTTALEQLPKAEAENPDFVAINVGINDAINNRENVKEYGENLKKMITAFPAEKVILVGPSWVDLTIKTAGNKETLVKYIAMAKDIAQETGVNYIDMYHHMEVYPDPAEFLQSDGLHPSKFGYHLLGALIARDIKNKLLG
ncbi:SGNH/GDSL hydrolase family protein [Enterococcus montenegrensis]|uniref:SGNH/GDSL hydrolase family protein n=1 Tax=Enterococcus montenegrensis TaxID=3031993 RepID=UPI00249EEF63|nr:SGNH/GDSL hydrolase family protein [Enterococcus montenegrensis]WHA09486.1 SGNH/GDSL hydrolase family protein [Enterococcus montenegrensis]